MSGFTRTVEFTRTVKASSTKSLPSWSSNTNEERDNKRLNNKWWSEEIKAGRGESLTGMSVARNGQRRAY